MDHSFLDNGQTSEAQENSSEKVAPWLSLSSLRRLLQHKASPGILVMLFVGVVLGTATIGLALSPFLPTPSERYVLGVACIAAPKCASAGTCPLLVTIASFTWCKSNTVSTTNTINQAINPIFAENQNTGTTDWQPTGNKDSIQGYTIPNTTPGTTIPLYVSLASSAATTFDVYVYRLGYYQGKGGTLKFTAKNIPGTYQGVYYGGLLQPKDCPTCTTTENYLGTQTDMTQANWKASYQLQIPTNWISGLYIIKVTPSGQTPGEGASIPLVITPSSTQKSDLIMIYPYTTAEAYNNWGGTNVYSNVRGKEQPPIPSNDPTPGIDRAYAVSFIRPLSEATGFPTLMEGYQMARFMEQKGYNVAYTTDSAIAKAYTLSTNNLKNYKGIIVAGHWEYVDMNERLAIQSAVDAGKNFITLSGNSMFWQVRYDNSYNTIRCYKNASLDPVTTNLSTTQWAWPPVNMPQDQLLKEIYRHAAFTNNGPYTVSSDPKALTSWVYTGINGVIANTILSPASNIIGTEGDMQSPSSWGQNDNITILGTYPVGNNLTVDTLLDEINSPNYHFIFNAGTILWTQALSDWVMPNSGAQNPITQSATIQQMTKNILDKAIGTLKNIYKPKTTTSLTPTATLKPTSSTGTTPTPTNAGTGTSAQPGGAVQAQ